jgi:TRAP-type C4-dicarboxylate transport system substrate-binding protein
MRGQKRRPVQPFGAGQVEVRLVDRSHLDARRKFVQNREDFFLQDPAYDLDAMVQAGVKIVPVSQAERDKMAGAVQPFYQEMYRQYGQDLQNIVSQIEAAR